MISDGWIKLHRKFHEKAFYKKDSEAVHLWIHILMSANHNPIEESLGGKPIICQPGQFTTGRKKLSKETGISESKIAEKENTKVQILRKETITSRKSLQKDVD